MFAALFTPHRSASHDAERRGTVLCAHNETVGYVTLRATNRCAPCPACTRRGALRPPPAAAVRTAASVRTGCLFARSSPFFVQGGHGAQRNVRSTGTMCAHFADYRTCARKNPLTAAPRRVIIGARVRRLSSDREPLHKVQKRAGRRAQANSQRARPLQALVRFTKATTQCYEGRTRWMESQSF